MNPETLAVLYQDAYWKSTSARDFGYTDYLSDRTRWLRTFERRYQLIAPRIERGKALDVGCAAGFFAEVLTKHGWEAYGADIARPMVAYAREHCADDRFFAGPIFEVPFSDGTFDLISFWDVVEHLPDPVSVLKKAHSLLKPEGMLVVETQDVEAWFARLLGSRWHHFKHPEHLYHFSQETLTELLARAGFAVEYHTHRRAGKYVSLDFIAERSHRLHPLAGRALSFLRGADLSLYVNLFDEQVALARKR